MLFGYKREFLVIFYNREIFPLASVDMRVIVEKSAIFDQSKTAQQNKFFGLIMRFFEYSMLL